MSPAATDAHPQAEDASCEATLAETLRALVASPELAFAWRMPETHEVRAGLARRVLGRLLLAALAPPNGIRDKHEWNCLRERLAESDIWPSVPGWEAEHDALVDEFAATLPRQLTPQELGPAYEQWLRRPPRYDAERGTVTLDAPAGHRKAGGCFYTPHALAYRLAAETLADRIKGAKRDGDSGTLEDKRDGVPLRLVDPACGTGAFLLAALAVLREYGHGAATAVAHSLHGVDCDAVAVGIARVLLFHAALDGETLAQPSPREQQPSRDELVAALRRSLRVGDALLGNGIAEQDHGGGAPAGMREDTPAAPVPLDWGAAFPAVAAAGGFDVVLGNPPWDKVKPLVREFFAERLPHLQRLNRKAFDAELERLLAEDARLAAEWEAYRVHAKEYAAALRARFRFLGRGDANLYKAFLERALALLAANGRLGFVLPYSICIDLGASELRCEALQHHAPLYVTRYASAEETFGITSVVNFVTLRASGRGRAAELEAMPSQSSAVPEKTPAAPSAAAAHEAATPVVVTRKAGGPEVRLPRRLIELVSPSSLSIPEVDAPVDVARLTRLYDGAPLLGGNNRRRGRAGTAEDGASEAAAPVGVLRVGWRRELDMTLDRWRFNTLGEGLPVFEGKMIYQFRPNWAGTQPHGDGATHERAVWVKESPPLDERGLPRPRYWVRPVDLARPSASAPTPAAVPSPQDVPGFRCAVRLIQNSRNRRVLIATVLPPGVVAGNSLATAELQRTAAFATGTEENDPVADLRDHLFLCGWLNDDELDWLIRLKIDANLNLFHLNQLPLPQAFAVGASSAEETAAVHRRYGVHALAQLLGHAPRVYAPLLERVIAPDDAWSAAARNALAG